MAGLKPVNFRSLRHYCERSSGLNKQSHPWGRLALTRFPLSIEIARPSFHGRSSHMARSLSLCCALLVTLALARVGHADGPRGDCDLVCKVYALSDFGADATLCQFIAETIPHVVQPESWSDQGGSARLRYYAPGKILVVYQSAAAHTEVESFLKSLKSAMPTGQGTAKSSPPPIMPAQYLAPTGAARTPPTVAAQPMPYPVPPATQQPKHLFHFIIRYEGEGIIDSNVAELYKAMAAANANGEGKPSMPVPACVGVPLSAYSAAVAPMAPVTPGGPMLPPGSVPFTGPVGTFVNQAPFMPPCMSGSCPQTTPPASPAAGQPASLPQAAPLPKSPPTSQQPTSAALPPLRSSPVPNTAPTPSNANGGSLQSTSPGAPANPAPANSSPSGGTSSNYYPLR